MTGGSCGVREAEAREARRAIALDLLRGRLYRLLDQVARARGPEHARLARRFERAWERYKLVTGPADDA